MKVARYCHEACRYLVFVDDYLVVGRDENYAVMVLRSIYCDAATVCLEIVSVGIANAWAMLVLTSLRN